MKKDKDTVVKKVKSDMSFTGGASLTAKKCPSCGGWVFTAYEDGCPKCNKKEKNNENQNQEGKQG